MKNKCSHKIEKSEYVKQNRPYDEEYDSDSWGNWEYWTESAFVDLDLHRLKCTLCGKIEYYSHAAKQFYEKGVKNDLIGYSLTKSTK